MSTNRAYKKKKTSSLSRLFQEHKEGEAPKIKKIVDHSWADVTLDILRYSEVK